MNIKSIITTILLMAVLSGCVLEQEAEDFEGLSEGVNYFILENAEVSLPLTSFDTLNPIYMDNLSYYHFSKLVFDGLFKHDSNMEPIPELASTYTVSQDGRTLDISLRPGIIWHNGDSFTAEDVVFTIRMMKSAGAESYLGKMILSDRGYYDNNLISARAISDTRVEISFSQPLGNMLDFLTFPILPSSLGNQALQREDFKPVGTGPYRFVEYVRFREVHLEANPDYREGKPDISYIVGKVFDSLELISVAFETGKLSMAPISDIDWDKYKHNERISIYEYVSGNHETLAFNHQEGIFASEEGANLKRAIMYGIDRQALIDKVFLQHGSQVDSVLNPSSYLYSQEASAYGYNKDMAKSILDDSRFSTTGEDGIRQDEEGNKLTVNLLVNGRSTLKMKTAEMIRSNLRENGMDVQFVLPSGANEEEVTEGMNILLNNGNFDMALIGWEQSVMPNYGLFLSSDRAGTGNYSYYQTAEMDQLLDGISRSWDENSKREAYNDFQEYFVENLPYGSLLFRNKALMVDSNISGPLDPLYYNLYNGLEKSHLIMTTK